MPQARASKKRKRRSIGEIKLAPRWRKQPQKAGATGAFLRAAVPVAVAQLAAGLGSAAKREATKHVAQTHHAQFRHLSQERRNKYRMESVALKQRKILENHAAIAKLEAKVLTEVLRTKLSRSKTRGSSVLARGCTFWTALSSTISEAQLGM